MANTTVLSFRPYFTATLNFYQDDRLKARLYDCLACGDLLPKGANEAVSYAHDYLGRWAHIACLNKMRVEVKDDRKAKKAAQNVHEAAFHAAQAAKRKTTTTTVSSTPAKTTVTTYTAPPAPTPDPMRTTVGSLDALAADLRATIEQEYEARLTAMVNIILAKNERIATLESDNEKLAMELSKIMVASVDPAPTTTHNQKLVAEIKAMGRCGAQKKDGTACRWDTRKTACMHHNRAA